MVAVASKCRTCRGPAIIDLPRHNAHFCADHFLELCRRQVVKAIERFDMIASDDRVLVAVSGGKDSLAVWDLLVELGYRADGLYIGLGIGDYSETSAEYARAFARELGLHLREISLRDDHGFDIPTASKATRRVPCSACGTSKRHLFDEAAIEGGYTVLVTAPNFSSSEALFDKLGWRFEDFMPVAHLARYANVLVASTSSQLTSMEAIDEPQIRDRERSGRPSPMLASSCA